MAHLLVRLRALHNLTKCGHTAVKTASNWRGDMRWFGTKPQNVQEHSASFSRNERGKGGDDLLKEFPNPKSLLSNTICKSLRLNCEPSDIIQYRCTDQGGVKKATVTLRWPCMIEEEGCASKKVDAEQLAAAAACFRLKEMGVIGPHKLHKRESGQKTVPSHSLHYDNWTDNVVREDECSHLEEDSLSKALSLFPQPKCLLARVIQAANSSSEIIKLLQYRTVGVNPSKCELTLLWPEKMTFTATARRRVLAEKNVAALACMKLKELELLDEDNNPLTHAKYHQEKIREAEEKERHPFLLEIPEHLKQTMREYLEEYPADAEVQKIWEEEEERGQQEVDEEEEDFIKDAITGRPYRSLSEHEAKLLSIRLQQEWENAKPGLSVELPVDAHRQRVVSAVRSSRAVVIAGETGCGKTTRIPRLLLEEHVRGGEGATCNVLVSQPRRISAVSVAHRVAQELGPHLKHHLGYQVRLESRPPEQSGGSMLFLTVGVLLKKLQSNPTLKGISHVVVDEVHERDINTDLLLALLRSSLEENPDLRVILMSATGDNQKLAEYFGGCPIVKVPGFMHPVKDKYLEDLLREMGRPPLDENKVEMNSQGEIEATPDLDLVVDVIKHIDRHGEPGAVLCFLPGWQDIKAVQDKLKEMAHFSSGSHMILPLHSSLSVADQQTVFQRPPVGRRKIVLATNVAETSITIDDIVHVVDAGAHKEQHYDPRTKVSSLNTVWISRSNVTQRKGRAGRCQPGQSYHLFPRKQLKSMAPFPVPEILRTPLHNLVLQAKIHSPNCKAVDFLSQVLDSPEKVMVRAAVKSLQDIGVLDSMETLTPLGKRVACMSCDPQLGKVLVLSSMFRCVLPIMSIVACLTRDPFHNSLKNRALVSKAKEKLSGSSYSDYLMFSRAILGWRTVQREGEREYRDDYLDDYALSNASLRFIKGLISQFSDNLQEAGLVSQAYECQRLTSFYNQHCSHDELLKAVLLAGLYPNLIKVKKGIVTKGGRFHPNKISLRTDTGLVVLHRSSVNRKSQNLPSRWLTFFSAVKSDGIVFIRDSSVVHPLALLLLTECDITEKVNGDKVEVSFPGSSLMRCELSSETWELLWELRTSIQNMLYRNLNNPSSSNLIQDGELISVLIKLLNGTESNPFKNSSIESEVD